jgi:hypothetical protein
VDTAPYREGKIIFQDKASVLVGEVASPKPTDLVLDICAAPGVKTSHLVQLMSKKGRIISVDYDERRLSSWRTLIDTMGVSNAEPVLSQVKYLTRWRTSWFLILHAQAPEHSTSTPQESGGSLENQSSRWRNCRGASSPAPLLTLLMVDDVP